MRDPQTLRNARPKNPPGEELRALDPGWTTGPPMARPSWHVANVNG